MRDWIGKGVIILGHLVSTIGCTIRGEHVRSKEDPPYCLLCKRRKFYS